MNIIVRLVWVCDGPCDGGREAILTDVSRADDFAIRFILDLNLEFF